MKYLIALFVAFLISGCGMTTSVIELPALKDAPGAVCEENSCWQQYRIKTQRNALAKVKTLDGFEVEIDNRGKASALEDVIKLYGLRQLEDDD